MEVVLLVLVAARVPVALVVCHLVLPSKVAVKPVVSVVSMRTEMEVVTVRDHA